MEPAPSGGLGLDPLIYPIHIQYWPDVLRAHSSASVMIAETPSFCIPDCYAACGQIHTRFLMQVFHAGFSCILLISSTFIHYGLLVSDAYPGFELEDVQHSQFTYLIKYRTFYDRQKSINTQSISKFIAFNRLKISLPPMKTSSPNPLFTYATDFIFFICAPLLNCRCQKNYLSTFGSSQYHFIRRREKLFAAQQSQRTGSRDLIQEFLRLSFRRRPLFSLLHSFI